MRKVFISYRREDSAADMTDRVYEHLSRRWPGRVFMDIDSLKAGDLFARKIDENLHDCVVLLVMMGLYWASLTDEHGARRIDNPGDYPSMEVGAALKRGVRVIPVLVGNATLPKREELPSEIAGLVDRQVLRLSREDFDADLQRLISSVARDMPRITWTQMPWKTLAAAVLLVFGVLAYIKFGPSLLSHTSSMGTSSSPAKVLDISGKWASSVIQSAYTSNARSTITFEFTQSGDTVVGSLTETDTGDAGKSVSTKGIVDGKVHDKMLSFYTNGQVTSDSGTLPYKEMYTGVLQKDGREIAFQRFNDVPSGGEIERFTATPK
jgi:TIR domain